MALPIISNEFRVVGTPELRFTPAGAAICTMRVVAAKKKKENPSDPNSAWVDDKTLWANLNIWRDLGEHAAESTQDKDLVIVSGDLYTKPYEDKQGNKKFSVEIDVREFGPSLRFRTTPHSGQQGGQAGRQQGNQGGQQSGPPAQQGNQQGNQGGTWSNTPQDASGWGNGPDEEPPF